MTETRKEIERQIKEIREELKPLYSEKEKLECLINDKRDQLSILLEKLDEDFVLEEARFSLDSNKEDIDWESVLKTSRSHSMLFHDRKNELVTKKLFGLSRDGTYFPELDQDKLKITINYEYTDEQLKEIYDNILFISKFLKPIKDKKKDHLIRSSFVIAIFGALNDNTSYDLILNSKKPEGYCEIRSGHYDMTSCASLLEALNVIRMKYWYTRKGSTSNYYREDE